MRRLAPALLVLLLMTGCADGGDPVSEQESRNAELRERPTFEQEKARLTGVRDDIRDALSARLGLAEWSEPDEGNAAGCADFPDSDGVTAFLPVLLLTGGVPDEKWPAAVEIVAEVAAQGGFGEVDVVVDRPGEHEVVLRGERGSLLRFGSTRNATLQLESGCHLMERDHS